jgi:TonB family protein
MAAEPRQAMGRLVTNLISPRMTTPSAATLSKFTYNWEAASNPKAPPVQVRWGGELKVAENKTDAPVPAVRPVPGFQEPKPSGSAEISAPSTPPQGNVAQAGDEGSGGKPITVYLPSPSPAPAPPPKAASNPDAAPKSIPDKITPPPAPPAPPAETRQAAARAEPGTAPAQVFEDQQKAIRSEGSGLFDTKGFPLGDYADLIIQRIKGNWFIPSNLKNSQGRTTVIFFITKDGRYSNAHIVSSSGSTSLDLAALNAVLVSNPFPPLPSGFPGDQVGAKFVFSYNERQ